MNEYRADHGGGGSQAEQCLREARAGDREGALERLAWLDAACRRPGSDPLLWVEYAAELVRFIKSTTDAVVGVAYLKDLVRAERDGARVTLEATPVLSEVEGEPTPTRVQADAAALNQVLDNLVSNAIKFSSKKDKPVIEVSAGSSPV